MTPDELHSPEWVLLGVDEVHSALESLYHDLDRHEDARFDVAADHLSCAADHAQQAITALREAISAEGRSDG